MNRTCFRCDWVGASDADGCPRCGAPLYPPRAAQRDARHRPAEAPPTMEVGGPVAPEPMRASRPATGDPGRIVAAVAAVFLVIALLLARGGGEASDPTGGDRAVAGVTPSRTGGRLVYAVTRPDGTARLWRWDVLGDRVARGPRVPEPVALVNVGSTTSGWLGLTSEDTGGRTAAVVDSLEPAGTPVPIGAADIVTWTSRGGSVLLVERGRLLDRCRRDISVTAVAVVARTRETVLRDRICGDVASAGRTNLGVFLTLVDGDGADVVGVGYPDAGVLLPDHGLIDIGPNGQMLVTEEEEFVDDARASGDDPPRPPTGAALRYRLFEDAPTDLLADSVSIRIDDVLAYTSAGTRALVVGRQGGDGPALWELPLGIVGLEHEVPRYLIRVRGVTEAAYASDGTAFVLTDGRLWHLRGDELEPVELPDGAPTPNGPLAWIRAEPTSAL